jgi:phosphoesterase RecJ-like protein
LTNSSLVDSIRDSLATADRTLIVSHIRPDGDAVGSLLGLGLSLQARGKIVQMVIDDGVPSSFRHLNGSEMVRNHPEGEFDLCITLDCSDLMRTGEALVGYGTPDINIDHHATNMNFGRINFVDTQAVSTTEIIIDHLQDWGLPINLDIANALLTGLITDTIGFRTANITPKALRMAARMMETGSDLSRLYHQALLTKSFQALRFWGSGLTTLERDGPVVWTTLTMADRIAAGYGGRDDADLINLLSAIEDAEIWIIFVEQPNGNIKVSWRSQPGIDVSKVAMGFGGGGHPAASGAEISGSIDQVRTQVLKDTFRLISNNHKPIVLNGIKNE